MALHRLQSEINQVYFCTVTCYRWLPLFEEAHSYDAVYRWFEFLKGEGCYVVGFVIMPNHFHVLIYPTQKVKTINKMIGEGKRFMSYDIVNKLKERKKVSLLKELASGVQAKEKEKGKLHQIFRLSFDARICYDEKMLIQKLVYIHRNPISGKWNLVDDYTLYPHSSAGFYERGLKSIFDVVHYKDL
jgi:REP element-mobilizing transposase RayT